MDNVEKLEKALRRFAQTGSKQDRIAIDAILHPERTLTEKGKERKLVYEASYNMGRRF